MNSRIKSDIDFIKNSKIISLNPNSVDIAIDECNTFLSHDNKNIVFTTGTEVFIKRKSFTLIQEYCNYLVKNKVNAKILTSTLSKIDNGFYPLTNLLCWNGAKHHGDRYPMFNIYDITNLFEKNKKFILSWRKYTNTRDYIISNVNLNKINYDECIFTYHKLNPIQDTRIDSVTDKFLNWNDIINLYSRSYISFVAETEYWISDDVIRDGSIVCFTEKIIIPMLCKSLPIVFASEGYVQNLKDNGLFVLNDFFGIKENDADSYSECISNINSMSTQKVHDIYMAHLSEINNNYKIMSEMVLKPFWNMVDGKFSNFI